MSHFKQLLVLSCFLGILSAMGLTVYNMHGAAMSSTSLPLSALVVTADQSGREASEQHPTPHLETSPSFPAPQVESTVSISDEALTDPDISVSSVISNEVYNIAAIERNVLSRTNILRSQNNLPPLSIDPTLSEGALTRSQDMLTHTYFSHVALDGCDVKCRFKKHPAPITSYAENIGEYKKYQTLSETELADRFFTLWLESAGHRENILSRKFNYTGIGVAAKSDRIVITVLFAQK